MFAVMMEFKSDNECWNGESDASTWGFAGPFEHREIAEEAVGAAISNGCPNAFVVSESTQFRNALGDGFERALAFAKSLIV